jgi:hypothetical protein
MTEPFLGNGSVNVFQRQRIWTQQWSYYWKRCFLLGPCRGVIRRITVGAKTSGKRCSKGTPIIKKSNPSLFNKGGTTKEEINKSWHWTNIWPWVPAGLDARSDRAGWLPAVSYCSALLCSAVIESGGGVEYLHRDPASRRRRRKGSLRSETVKYGRESQGTWTRESLR